jgi:hypothetical protein
VGDLRVGHAKIRLGDRLVAEDQKVDIEGSRTPARPGSPSGASLESLRQLEEIPRRALRHDLDHGVEELGLRNVRQRRCPIEVSRP